MMIKLYGHRGRSAKVDSDLLPGNRRESLDPPFLPGAALKSDIRALRVVKFATVIGSGELPEGIHVALDASCHRLDVVGASRSTAIPRDGSEREFLAPFQRNGAIHLEMSEISTSVASPGSPEAVAGARLIAHEYGSRYLTGDLEALTDLSRHGAPEAHRGNVVTLVASSFQNGSPVVIGTMCVFSGPQLGLLDFFEPRTVEMAQLLDRPGIFECARLALHPVLGIKCVGAADQLRALYRVLVVRKLFSSARRMGMSGPSFFIAAPHVARYVRATGLVFEQTDGFVSRNCARAQQTREAFAAYWEPSRPDLQPRVFTSDLRLNSITWQIADRELVVGRGLRTGRRTPALQPASL